MEDNAYIGGVIAGIGYLLVGFRLLRLTLRTGKIPELFLTVSFLAWGTSYAVYNLPLALADEWLFRFSYPAGRIINAMGGIAYALFAWSVFRRRDAWGLWMIVGVVVCVVAGLAGSLWLGDWEGVHPIRNPWWWSEWVGVTAVEAWIGAEAIVQYGKARQRLRLGLSTPLSCNRFLLLGLVSVSSVVLQFVVVIQSIEYELIHRWSASMDSVVGAIELATIAMFWLVLFPPTFYRRWINGAAPVARAVKG
jgi:hypothetical protein